MAHPRRTVTNLIAEITGNVTDQAMIKVVDGRGYGGPAIECGGRIVLGTATTVDVLVEDSNGKVLHNATVAANKDIDPIPAGVKLPLLITTTNISNSTHTLTVYWDVKK